MGLIFPTHALLARLLEAVFLHSGRHNHANTYAHSGSVCVWLPAMLIITGEAVNHPLSTVGSIPVCVANHGGDWKG